LLARATYIMVLFFTHIPFKVNHAINATPPERLQQLEKVFLPFRGKGVENHKFRGCPCPFWKAYCTKQFKTHEIFENCRAGFPWCLTMSCRILSENIKRKKGFRCLYLKIRCHVISTQYLATCLWRQRSGHEWTTSSSLHDTRTVN